MQQTANGKVFLRECLAVFHPRQIFLTMKITAFLLTVVCFGATANTNAQRITLQEKRISLEKALLAIKQQSGYNLFYKVETVQQYGKAVDVNIKNATVAEALAQVFQKQHLTYEIAGSTIIVKEKQEKKEVAGVVNTFPIQQAAVLVLPLDVKGVVRDESGKPAVGVSVIIKGTQRGTTTNEAGEFSLTGVSDNAILVFSSVNLQTFEVKVQAGNANSITVTLKAKISELGDIAVTTVSTGIQDIPKERSTGSFGFINNQIVERTVSTDIASRIRGTTAGLLVSNSSSARTGISVRTASTILANKQALIIVDNFPFDGDLNNINPNDVETVTILKDAAAASIWGVLAGNGVVVITTKKGRYNQKAKVTFNSNFRITDRPDLFYTNSQLSGKDYVDLETYLFGRGFYNSNITSTTRPRLTPAVEI
ncbi:MAG TPA: carboxypeptidase-like regulatory domain-containing protein, partial [Flavisolibacter sp.]|nr:carboxypeptidase-like regulatory domain-containing protein [Flavisolibacter sp.]